MSMVSYTLNSYNASNDVRGVLKNEFWSNTHETLKTKCICFLYNRLFLLNFATFKRHVQMPCNLVMWQDSTSASV